MNKFFVYVIILLCFGMLTMPCQASDKPISTQGLTLEEGIEKNVKPAKAELAEMKQIRKMKRKYFRNVARLKSKKYKKNMQEKNLEFYNSRLEIKKQKLEELNSNGSKKGEH